MNLHYKETKRYFDQIALKRNGFYASKKSIWHLVHCLAKKKVLELIEDAPSTILDAGCGRGDFTVSLARLFSNSYVQGVDYSSDMLKIGKCLKRGVNNVTFKACYLWATPFNDQQFDLTLCINVLHHIDERDFGNVIAELARVTKRQVILDIRNKKFILYLLNKFIAEKISLRSTVYWTTISKIEKLWELNGFVLDNIVHIFGIEKLSPIVILKFTRNETWKLY